MDRTERAAGRAMERTVMVVEDDALIRDAVVEILATEGFDPIAAGDGQEALARLRHDKLSPALILLDLMMPVMNGWEFRAAQLADPELAAIPVVVMSASDPEGVRADALVPKPFDVAALLAAISRVTAGRADQGGACADRSSATCRSATEFMQ